MWPQKWYASASPGRITAPTIPAPAVAATAPPARPRNERRDVPAAGERGSSTPALSERPSSAPAPSQRPSSAPAPSARGRDHGIELARVVHGPFREHDAARPERDGERRPGHPRGGPCLGLGRLVEATHLDALERVGGRHHALAERATGAGEEGE